MNARELWKGRNVQQSYVMYCWCCSKLLAVLGKNFSHLHMQMLMSVLKALTPVLRTVTTMLAPTPAAVTSDTDLIKTREHVTV